MTCLKNIIHKIRKIGKQLFVFLVVLMNSSLAAEEEEYLNQKDRLMRSFVDEVERQYDIYCCVSGGSFVDNMKKVQLTFRVEFDLTVDEARDLEVKLLTKLLDMINNDELVRPYLATYPFTIDRVNIGLSFAHHRDQFAYLSCVNKTLFYRKEPSNGPLVDFLAESYEEAEKIVREHPIAKQPAERTAEVHKSAGGGKWFSKCAELWDSFIQKVKHS